MENDTSNNHHCTAADGKPPVMRGLGLIKVCADPHCEAVYHNAPSKPCHCEFCGIPLKRINDDTYWKKFSNHFFQYDWETGEYFRMKKVTIITGAAASGKTTKAREMAATKKAVWLDQLNLEDHFIFQSITPETEVIVIDELGKKSFPAIKMLITTPFLMVNRRGKMPIEVERPEIIIVSNDLKEEDFRECPHLEIIEM